MAEKQHPPPPKLDLVKYEALPEYLKDNEFILGHYRCEWPIKQTILSVFSLHNETINIWTHLIGFFLFLFLAVLTATTIRDHHHHHHASVPCLESMDTTPSLLSWNSISLGDAFLNWIMPCRFSGAINQTSPCFLATVREEVAAMTSPMPPSPVTRWPLLAFLGGAMLCLLTSSACHLLLCHSKPSAYVMLRLDYAGIASLIVASFYPTVHYSFLCHPFFSNLYMGLISAFGVAAVLTSLLPAFQTAAFRPARAALFSGMAASGVVPIVHKLVAFGDRPAAVVSVGYELLMVVFYGLGVMVYAARVPERWSPGRFDVVGHSHQLFHVLVVAGAYSHYLAGLVYLRWRDGEGCQ